MSNTTTPKILKTKNKVDVYALAKAYKKKYVTDINHMYKPKHYPPSAMEWVNSVYYYGKNAEKLLPSLDINAYNLIKSYFNLYIIKHNNKTRAKRWRIRTKKSTSSRLLSGKPTMKHTNDRVNITIYTYDRSSEHYIGKIGDMFSIDQLKENYFDFYKNLKLKYLLLERRLVDKLENKLLKNYLRDITINKYKSLLCESTQNYNKTLTYNKINLIMETKNNPLFIHFLKKELGVIFGQNLNNYIRKVMWDEIVSISYKQCIRFEESKYEKQYIQLLTALLENIYNKKVVVDIVNLKYFYNNSSIFSSTLMAKLKMKKNRVINVLALALDRFEIPPINRIKIYNEMYNRKTFIQNTFLKNLVPYNYITSVKLKHVNKDIIDTTLSNDSHMYSSIDYINKIKKLPLNTCNVNLHKIIDSLKNKFTKGIRIEVAGRLTKRNTAERSVHKLRYKGNIRNQDSSMKKLPTVLLRGHAKSNLAYVQSKSRLRIGAFGLKTWVSSD